MFRKNVICAAAGALALLAAGCGGGQKKAADSDSISEAQPTDTLALATPDLLWKELSGPVECCMMEFYDMAEPADVQADSVAYNADGSLAALATFYTSGGRLVKVTDFQFSYDGGGNSVRAADKASSPDAPMAVSLVRGRDGEIVSWEYAPTKDVESDLAYTEDYSWNEFGLPKSRTINGWEWYSTTSYSYDDAGRRTKAVTKTSGIEYEATDTHTYRYTEIDDHGNWTEREVNVASEEDDEGHKTTHKSLRVERRRIHYRPSARAGK